MENLDDLLEYGRAAVWHAKQPVRDGVALHLHNRGGAPIKVRAEWMENSDERITRYTHLNLAEALPGKLPYDLRKLADLYEDWPADTVESAIRQDVIRIIRDSWRGPGWQRPRLRRPTQVIARGPALPRLINDSPALRFASARRSETPLQLAQGDPTDARNPVASIGNPYWKKRATRSQSSMPWREPALPHQRRC